jgi:hypothetical protein
METEDEFGRYWGASGIVKDALGGYLCMIDARLGFVVFMRVNERHEEQARVSEHVTFDLPSCIFRDTN